MTAPLILAMDISKTRTGICEGRVGARPTFMSISGNDMSDTAAMMRLGNWLIARLRIDPPDWIYFEAQISLGAFMGEYDEDKGKVRMTSSPATTITLAKMIGIVEFIGGMKHMQMSEAKVQTVRKAFIGHGNLKGEVAKPRVMALSKALGWEPKNHDESDAGAVWFYAGTQVSPRHYTPITPMMQAKVATEVDAAMASRGKGRARA